MRDRVWLGRRRVYVGDDHAVFWNHGSSVLSMNERVFVPTSDRLVTVTAGDNHQLAADTEAADAGSDDNDLVVYTLRLDSVSLRDEGDYSCQVPSQPSLIQRHRIVVNGQSNRIPHSTNNLFILMSLLNYTVIRYAIRLLSI